MKKTTIKKAIEPIKKAPAEDIKMGAGEENLDGTGSPLTHEGRCTVCAGSIITIGDLQAGERTYSTSDCTHYPKQ